MSDLAKLIKASKVIRNKERCSSCGFKIRGANHNEGKHHQIGRQGKAEIK